MGRQGDVDDVEVIGDAPRRSHGWRIALVIIGACLLVGAAAIASFFIANTGQPPRKVETRAPRIGEAVEWGGLTVFLVSVQQAKGWKMTLGFAVANLGGKAREWPSMAANGLEMRDATGRVYRGSMRDHVETLRNTGAVVTVEAGGKHADVIFLELPPKGRGPYRISVDMPDGATLRWDVQEADVARD